MVFRKVGISKGHGQAFAHAPCRAHNKKGTCGCRYLDFFLAGLTGLEPATSSVTGWHSNRLSYNPR